jgi:hypothetical protein
MLMYVYKMYLSRYVCMYNTYLDELNVTMLLYVCAYDMCMGNYEQRVMHLHSSQKIHKVQVKSRFSAEILNQDASHVACLYSPSFRIRNVMYV